VSIALDTDSAVAVVFGLYYPEYRWFHILEGSIVAVVIVAVVIFGLRSRTGKLPNVLKLRQESFPKKVVLASFLGVHLHLLLDVPLHPLYDLRMPEMEFTTTGLGYTCSAYFDSLLV